MRAVGSDVPIFFNVLNVHGEQVRASPFAQRFDQAQLNAAFERERDRIGKRPNVTWFEPDPLA